MLKEETLKEKENNTFEEPEGDILEIIERHGNSVTVLTEVKSEKGGGGVEEESEELPDPSDYTVAELEEELRGSDFTDEETATLLEAEQQGKNRKSARKLIEDI